MNVYKINGKWTIKKPKNNLRGELKNGKTKKNKKRI